MTGPFPNEAPSLVETKIAGHFAWPARQRSRDDNLAGDAGLHAGGSSTGA